MTILLLPLGLLRRAAGFLPLGLVAGPLKLLFNPYALMALAAVIAIGWAYQKGRGAERAAQARAIIELNKSLVAQEAELQRRDADAEKRLTEAMATARHGFNDRADKPQCTLDKNDAARLADIAGD